MDQDLLSVHLAAALLDHLKVPVQLINAASYLLTMSLSSDGVHIPNSSALIAHQFECAVLVSAHFLMMPYNVNILSHENHHTAIAAVERNQGLLYTAFPAF